MSYYTPSIEEFHVGFEYEELEFTYTDKGWYTSKEQKWLTKIFKATDYIESYYLAERVKRSLFTTSIRVKYLDKEDIESLGFTYEKTYAGLDEDFFEKLVLPNAYSKYFYLDYNYGKKYCRIYWSLDNDGDVTVFAGTINNKSELKRLLKQLGINE